MIESVVVLRFRWVCEAAVDLRAKRLLSGVVIKVLLEVLAPPIVVGVIDVFCGFSRTISFLT